MKVCHFTSVHKLRDTRILYKECRSLVEFGIEVVLVVTHSNVEIIDGVQIDPLPVYSSRFFSMIYKPWIAFRKCLKHKADIYHFHDPELIPIALLLRLLGKKVVYDVHEDVPADILEKEWIKPDFMKHFLAGCASLAEYLADLFMSGIVVATDTIASKFNNKRSILLPNVPVLKLIDSVEPDRKSTGPSVIIYVGGLTRIRGIKEIVQAMENLDARLWLIGEWDDKNYRDECMGLPSAEKIEQFGFLKPELAIAKMKAADIAIVNFLPARNHLKALPNKPFEYMACRLPVLMSSFPYWQKIFGDFALFADPLDPMAIRKQLQRLLESTDLRHKLASAGRTAIEEKYCWEKEAPKLRDLYSTILE